MADHAGWLAELDRLAIPSACAVGNSFGASVAWRLRVAARCHGLVIVDGVAMPPTAYARCLVAGDGPPPPPPPVLVVWGARDRPPGTAVRTAERLVAHLPGVELAVA